MTVVAVLVALWVANALIPARDPAQSSSVRIADADAGVTIDGEARDRTFTYAPGATAEIQGWIATAVARMQPAARRLIDAVDGQITVQTHPSDGRMAGFVQPGVTTFSLSLDATGLRGAGQEIRDHVIAHELGHVVDIALVPAALNAQLDQAVPRIGGCAGGEGSAGCAAVEERFADTFAKWALNDPVVLSGAMSVGYRVAPPANLALWGEPLADLPA